MKKSWDYKKYHYRFYHTTLNNETWYLFSDNNKYFFSKDKPVKGEPIDLPEGFEVKIDKTTKKPILIEKKTVTQAVDDFFANEPKETQKKSEQTTKKKRKLPSEIHDRYHRWKY